MVRSKEETNEKYQNLAKLVMFTNSHTNLYNPYKSFSVQLYLKPPLIVTKCAFFESEEKKEEPEENFPCVLDETLTILHTVCKCLSLDKHMFAALDNSTQAPQFIRSDKRKQRSTNDYY